MKFEAYCVGCFAGLACQTRLEILNLLEGGGRMSVLEIVKHFQISQPTISHHLGYLEEAGILASKKIGRKVYYFIHQKCQKQKCQLF